MEMSNELVFMLTGIVFVSPVIAIGAAILVSICLKRVNYVEWERIGKPFSREALSNSVGERWKYSVGILLWLIRNPAGINDSNVGLIGLWLLRLTVLLQWLVGIFLLLNLEQFIRAVDSIMTGFT